MAFYPWDTKTARRLPPAEYGNHHRHLEVAAGGPDRLGCLATYAGGDRMHLCITHTAVANRFTTHVRG